MTAAPSAVIPLVVVIHPGKQANAPLDFTVSEDMKYYQKAIMPLDESDRYDLSPTKLKGFLDNAREKADIYGWSTVIQIPNVGAIPAINMLNKNGQGSLAECAAHATV
jgi:hypothetical protein